MYIRLLNNNNMIGYSCELQPIRIMYGVCIACKGCAQCVRGHVKCQ